MSVCKRVVVVLVLAVVCLQVLVAGPAAADDGRICVTWNGQTIYCIDY